MGFESPWHWIIVVIVVAALFGYKKLPDMSRSVARSLRIFKTEMKGMSEDDAARQAHAGPQSPADSPYGANPYTVQTPVPQPPTIAVNPPAPAESATLGPQTIPLPPADLPPSGQPSAPTANQSPPQSAG
jgi:sec-independent protein translocase protein TatA